ncbi:Surface antigen (D15) [Candidatus Methylomirabilis lanthanidiphila]|uniref:Outer membrane protein assembly factor BamA n=1 Tax=Candidatus Methylomirabilis lanthanidiphila TaxID=2211376 RepID=A0A564ZLA9_9BACT|nr:outer membrane protein assembly factor BamA [Candidatus Methylomirabilis lanthanidiphila]VUZ85963.1 Surface antigen (D15) [Candidatus Methylomirabilis lanthanidiphila]
MQPFASKVRFLAASSLILSVFFVLAFGNAFGQEQAPVKQLDIKGSRKIDEATIRFKLKTRVGEPFSLEKIREDVKTVYRLGFYDDVAVDADIFEGGLKITFILTEKPTIREVKIRGNKGIATDKIKEKLTLTEGGVFNPQTVAANAEKVRLLYEEEGYYQAKVVPQTEKTPEGDISVTVEINEGGKFEIATIRILGAKGLSEDEIKARIATKELFLFFFFGTLKRDELQRDLDRIKAYYLDNGYLDIKVGEPEIRVIEAKQKLEIGIRVDEGAQYRVGELGIAGNTVFSTEEVLKPLQIARQGIFSREVLQRDMLTLTDRYSERGYLFADVTPTINTDRESHIVDVGLDISEGKQAFLERIEIAGNTKTRDKVIRREIPLNEGDLYNSRLLARGRQNLTNLGFFEEVKIETRRGTAEDRVDIDVMVKEKPTGSFSVGGGFSSIDGILGSGSVTQENFLGLGQRMSLSAQLGARASRFVLNFFDPHILDTGTSLDLSAFNQRMLFDQQIGFDQDTKGGSIAFGRRLHKELFGSLGYRYERDKIFSVADNAPTLIQKQEGTSTTGRVSLGLSMNLTDNRLDPTTGFTGAATYQIAGNFLGGSNKFQRINLDLGYYHPLVWKLVGHIRGNLIVADAYGGKSLPVQERIYLGGTTTVRGFKTFHLSPTETVTDADGSTHRERIGGTKALYFNNEVMFPLYEPLGLKGLVFFDAGNAFAGGESLSLTDLRPTAGGGVRVATPFGLVRVEWGLNLDKRPGESSSAVHLTMGSVF